MSKRAYKLKEIILPVTDSPGLYQDRQNRIYLAKPKGPRHQSKRKNK